MLSENKLIQNRYLIKTQIGRGGMGAVYLAEDQRFNNRFVALKQMLHTENQKLREAFEREANLLNKLKHPRLPKVSDFFSEDGYQYLAMEFVSGDDLGTILTKNGNPFSYDRVLKWADSLLEILEYLHLQNPPIIHRDIKPQNLKLNQEDKIILLDFGLAKDTFTHLSRLVSSRSLVGYTPNYAPLEQVRGDHSTIQTDLYSVSATIYHLLTNLMPASSLTRVQAKIDELPDPLLPAYQLNPSVPYKLSEVLTQGLSLKKENRPVSASAMRESLRNIFDEPKRLFDIPTEQTFSYSNSSEVVNTISSLPSPLILTDNSNASVSKQKKSENRSSLLLFGVLFCLLIGGIAASYFVGQWISAKMNPASNLQNSGQLSDQTNKNNSENAEEPKSEAYSANNNLVNKSPVSSINTMKSEIKPSANPKKPIPQKTPEKRIETFNSTSEKPKIFKPKTESTPFQ